jgi:hypothetical protein
MIYRLFILPAVVLLLCVSCPDANAAQVPFDLIGNAGVGLLPGNEVGNNTPVSSGGPSSAIGGETGLGLIYDTDTNVLNFSYEFSGLSGGLANVQSGMHLHLAGSLTDPLNSTGGIVFNLNSGTDANVSLTTPMVAIGSTSGSVAGTATFTEAQEVDLFLGRYYLNIHTATYMGGELRGNLVAIPEPTSVALVGFAMVGCGLWYRRR